MYSKLSLCRKLPHHFRGLEIFARQLRPSWFSVGNQVFLFQNGDILQRVESSQQPAQSYCFVDCVRLCTLTTFSNVCYNKHNSYRCLDGGFPCNLWFSAKPSLSNTRKPRRMNRFLKTQIMKLPLVHPMMFEN